MQAIDLIFCYIHLLMKKPILHCKTIGSILVAFKQDYFAWLKNSASLFCENCCLQVSCGFKQLLFKPSIRPLQLKVTPHRKKLVIDILKSQTMNLCIHASYERFLHVQVQLVFYHEVDPFLTECQKSEQISIPSTNY